MLYLQKLYHYVHTGIKKKLQKLAKYKDCDMANDWIKRITNYCIYLCAESSTEGNGSKMAIKWKSLMEHICDKHDECYHLPLGVEERRKKWLQPGILVLTVYN